VTLRAWQPWAVAVALAGAVASCYSPHFPHCAVQCGSGAEACPAGTSCRDGFCLADGEASCAGGSDGGVDGGGDGGLPVGTYRRLSVGAYHACAIDTDGALWCWGRNDQAQLGQSDREARGLATRVGGNSDWLAVSAGDGHTCGIRGSGASGALYCWGNNDDGQVGNGSTSQAYQFGPDEIDAGTLWSQVSAGGIFSCGIHADGTLWCWGSNIEGQIGTGEANNPDHAWVPLQVGSEDGWTAVSVGRYHACALHGAALVCWGYGDNGRLGTGDSSSLAAVDSAAAIAPPSGFVWDQVSAGGGHTCAHASDGHVYCWGVDYDGQAGGGPAEAFVPIDNGALGVVTAGDRHTCSLGIDQTRCWGSNDAGQTGGYPDDNPDPHTATLPGVTAVGAGDQHSCALLGDGTIQCWGSNGWGQIGDGTVADKRAPVRVASDADPWTGVDVGVDHTCAVNQAGQLWCWGRNLESQLGLGAGEPVEPLPRQVQGTVTWSQVVAGSYHSCAIGDSTHLYCWGRNSEGQTGPAGDQAAPTEILTGTDWAQVTTGTDTTCARSTSGVRTCFGRNQEGQKGRGDTTADTSVETFSGDPVTWSDLSMGVWSACGVAQTSGELYCWGDDGSGALGDGSATQAVTPTPTLSSVAGAGWTEVHVAAFHACGLRAGHLLCWGYGAAVGDANSGWTQPTPTDVGSSAGWVSVDTGGYHSCAVRSSGQLYCWGNNDQGQLGSGGGADQGSDTVPATAIGSEFARVSAGGNTACAIARSDATSIAAGSLWCWGENLYGEVGDGTSGRFTPTVVVSQP